MHVSSSACDLVLAEVPFTRLIQLIILSQGKYMVLGMSISVVWHILDKRLFGEAVPGLRPGRVGLKIPCTYENLSLVSEVVKSGYKVALTAIFSLPQVYLAYQAGAQYVIPYVNRSTRLLGDGIDRVCQMRAVIDADGAHMQILAASIKSADEAIAALLAGAHHLSLPLALIESMGEHALSYQAIEEFKAAQKG
jgi:transaldolase